MHIKGIHNTVSLVLSRLDFGPVQDEKANWMTFTTCWFHYTMHAPTEESTYTHQHKINIVFANCSEEDVIYPLIVQEIAQSQKDNTVLKKLSKTDKYSTQLIEDTQVLCKHGKMVIHSKSFCTEQLAGITTTCSILDIITCSNVLERYEKYHLITCQKLSYMSS
jgi:hypothetical protein